jgi:drug/metabolite transporter (DMT)-like permease
MSPRRIVGVILVVVGLVAVLWGGISWNRQKTVVDAGPLKVTTTERQSIPLPPVLGAVALAAGVIMLVVPSRRHV